MVTKVNQPEVQFDGVGLDNVDLVSSNVRDSIRDLAKELALNEQPGDTVLVKADHVKQAAEIFVQAARSLTSKVNEVSALDALKNKIQHDYKVQPECEHFTCVCESDQHIFSVKLWDFSEFGSSHPSDFSLSFHLFMCNYKNMWQRIWAAIRYVFGYRCRFGDFESADLKYEDADRLIAIIEKFKEKVESSQTNRVYYKLKIAAPSPTTEIYIADRKGNLVQKETGSIFTSLLPGEYTYQFGVGGIAQNEKVRFTLSDHMEIK